MRGMYDMLDLSLLYSMLHMHSKYGRPGMHSIYGMLNMHSKYGMFGIYAMNGIDRHHHALLFISHSTSTQALRLPVENHLKTLAS